MRMNALGQRTGRSSLALILAMLTASSPVFAIAQTSPSPVPTSASPPVSDGQHQPTTAAPAQTVVGSPSDPSDPAAQSSAATVAAQPSQTVTLAEGTEVSLRFEEALSSRTNSQGDRFAVIVDEPIELPGGLTIPEGYRGVGEVTAAERAGMLGHGGQLHIAIDYIRIGETRVRLRGSRGQEGRGELGWTIGLTILLGPLGLLVSGHNIDIPRGQHVTAYVDSPVTLTFPLAPPPT